MSETNPTPEELAAEIERLNAELEAAKSTGGTTAAPDQTISVSHGSGVLRETASGAKVIGAAADPRGGTVIAYSNGTTKIAGGGEGEQPWGSVPEGDYVSFFTSNDGNTYNFINAEGIVETVDNPVSVRPPGAPDPNA